MSAEALDPASGRKQLFVLGLRRSGTTIFWKVLRENTGFLSFNEPFNPLISRFGASEWESVAAKYYSEIVDLQKRSGSSWRNLFEPIHPAQELTAHFTDSQARYLSLLLEAHHEVLIESTRCHFKARALADLAMPDAVLVHLYRSPAAFATSHLVPSGRSLFDDENAALYPGAFRQGLARVRSRGRRALDKATFWRRGGRYDNWSIESIVGHDEGSPFFQVAAQQGLDARRICRMPAVGKVLAYWRVCFDRIEEDGRKHFGNRFMSVNLEHWTANPKPTIRRLLEILGVGADGLDVSSIGRPSGPYQPANPAWNSYFEVLGIDPAALLPREAGGTGMPVGDSRDLR